MAVASELPVAPGDAAATGRDGAEGFVAGDDVLNCRQLLGEERLQVQARRERTVQIGFGFLVTPPYNPEMEPVATPHLLNMDCHDGR